MDRLVWRLRVFLGRLIPHTPVKRWGYGVGVLAALLALRFVSPVVSALSLLVIAAIRYADIRRSAARRPQLNMRPYFFEGTEERPGKRR